MALKTKVKVGQVTNLSEARYCAGMGADLLGFPIGSQAEQISIDEAKEISGWISGPQLVFETTPCLDARGMQEVTRLSPNCHIEIPLEHWPQECVETIKDYSLILAAEYEDRMDILKKAEGLNVQYIVMKIHHLAIDWDEIGALNAHIPLLIAYPGIKQEQLVELLQRPITGIALTGTPEIKPGLKEYDHLADILEALETD